MRLDLLLNRLHESVAQERAELHRAARYILPLLLLPLGFALAQMVRGWLGLLTGGLAALVLLMQTELFIRPLLDRARTTSRDMATFLGLPRTHSTPDLRPVLRLLAPAVLAVAASSLVAFPTMLARVAAWQRLLALALTLFALYAVWQRLEQAYTLLESIDSRIAAARSRWFANAPAPTPAPPSPRRPLDLLDPTIAARIAQLPAPALAISPAAQALLRVEAYLTLRDFPNTSDADLRAAQADLARQAHTDELRHWLLPPVGGKLYVPIAANGTLARALGETMRKLGMDGAFSATLGTWLVRLPPARSYAVAGRLIDAVIELGLPPPGTVLPHHLTVQGDLKAEARVLSIVHLLAAPMVMEARPGHATDDERPFVMRGGGVLDDMGGRSRGHGPRTDFIDGFIFAQAPGMDDVEFRTAHTINLRVKQVLAFGLLANARPPERRAPVEQQAAEAYIHLRVALRDLLAAYGLEAMLAVDWIDGRWSELWPLIERMNACKQKTPVLIDQAQQLRDTALDALEGIAVRAT